MRESYHKHLAELHTEIIRMGALCEDAVRNAFRDKQGGEESENIEREIDLKEREVENLCARLILREQPVAGDLREIMAAQRIAHELERVGDQADDIAELYAIVEKSAPVNGISIKTMADETASMLSDSVDSFVYADLEKALETSARDDIIDKRFIEIKKEIVSMIERGEKDGEACLDLLMIAKYLERIGDHAQNICEWVRYSVMGDRGKRV